MAPSDLLPDIYAPAFELRIGNAPLDPESAASILEVSVTEHLDPPNEFSFRLNDPTLKFIDQREERFTEGTRVEVSLGYRGDTRLTMVGEVTAVSADFPSSGAATLEVEGYDLLHAATRGTTSRIFGGPGPDTALSDSEVVSQIASDMQLVPEIDRTPSRTEPWIQNNVTNLEMLEDIARASGFFLWVDGTTLYFKQNPPVPTRVRLRWGQNLLSFTPRVTTAGRVNAFEVRAWDYVQKQAIKGRAERSVGSLSVAGEHQVGSGSGGRSERVMWRDHGIRSAVEAQAYADRLLADQEQGALGGSGSSVGRTDIRAGSILELSGIGRFSRDYQVEEVTHTIGEGGYQTSFRVRSLA
jgi:phage protein D